LRVEAVEDDVTRTRVESVLEIGREDENGGVGVGMGFEEGLGNMESRLGPALCADAELDARGEEFVIGPERVQSMSAS